VTKVLLLAVALALPSAALAQPPKPFNWCAKFHYHAAKTYAPQALVGFAAYAAGLQELDAPQEWGQGGSAYAKRFASTVAWSGIHSALAFGLDSTLHQDPRYYRAGAGTFLRRAAHAIRGTILTRTDAGRETLSTWRLGSGYGAAFLSDLWYPSRFNTVRSGFIYGSATLGFDAAANIAAEFWPDIKRKVLRKK
jgi:hypothetical protein